MLNEQRFFLNNILNEAKKHKPLKDMTPEERKKKIFSEVEEYIKGRLKSTKQISEFFSWYMKKDARSKTAYGKEVAASRLAKENEKKAKAHAKWEERNQKNNEERKAAAAMGLSVSTYDNIKGLSEESLQKLIGWKKSLIAAKTKEDRQKLEADFRKITGLSPSVRSSAGGVSVDKLQKVLFRKQNGTSSIAPEENQEG